MNNPNRRILRSKTISSYVYLKRMRLIDILNGLHFAGADFLSALEVAPQRKKSLTPIFRRILSFAASEPRVFECRFSQSLLDASAFLLAEWEDSQFLSLARPLLSAGDHPSLFGCYPEDAARLIARAMLNKCEHLTEYLMEEDCTESFAICLLEAMVYIAAWYPERRDEIVRALLGLLRHPMLVDFSTNVRDSLVECCCRIRSSDFLLDLYLANEEGALPEELINHWRDARPSSVANGVWLDSESIAEPISACDPFLLQHRTIFDASEISGDLPLSDLESKALAAFNAVAVPCHDFERRLATASGVPGIGEISLRVIRRALKHPDKFRLQHWPVAVSAAICLGSTTCIPEFAETLICLLQLPSDKLEMLLGDDLTEMCDFGLAVASSQAPSNIYRLVEDINASFASRSVALGALQIQVRLGYASRSEIAVYVLELFSRRESLAGDAWFWSDVADIGADLSISEMLPLLRKLVEEEVFIDVDGRIYTDYPELEDRFATKRSTIELPDPPVIDAVYLLSRCSGYESISVRSFLADLELANIGEM